MTTCNTKTAAETCVSRKDFLRMMFLGGAAAAAAPLLPETAGAAPRIELHKNTLAVLIDLSRCIGCRSCEAACNEANHLGNHPAEYESDKVFETTRRTDATHFTVVNRRVPSEGAAPVFVKNQCMHCSEPACVSACPARAFEKNINGAVTYNPDVCIGCRYCMQACTFAIPAYEYDRVTDPRVRKCEMCFHNIDKQGAPACASICPQDAIVFGRREVLIEEARKRLEKDATYVKHIFGEKELGGTSVLYVSKVPFDQLGFPKNLPQEPMPKATYGFLSTIPVLHITLPVLLAGIYSVTRRRDDVRAEDDHE